MLALVPLYLLDFRQGEFFFFFKQFEIWVISLWEGLGLGHLSPLGEGLQWRRFTDDRSSQSDPFPVLPPATPGVPVQPRTRLSELPTGRFGFSAAWPLWLTLGQASTRDPGSRWLPTFSLFSDTSRKGSHIFSIIITSMKLKQKEVFLSRWYKDEQLRF